MTGIRIVLFFVWITFLPVDVKADTIFISNGDVVSLITAVQQANQNNKADTIYLALKGRYLFTSPIASPFDGFSALPTVTLDQSLANKIIIYGNGSTLERDENAAPFRIWMVFGGSLELHDIVIRNGHLDGGVSGSNGAGIANYGELVVHNATFVNNAGNFLGGALYISVSTPTELINCTITGNKAAYGSAIYFFSSSTSITNCTIAKNTGTNTTGAALYNALIVDDPNRRVFLKNSMVALNTTSNGTQNDIAGAIISLGRNLVGANNDANAQVYMPVGSPSFLLDYVGTAASPIDPLLNAPADNGGLTPTMSIQSVNSFAFNNGGQPAFAPATDQAGNYRLGNAEIGSLEFNNNPILNPAIEIWQSTMLIPQGSTFDFGNVVNGQSSGVIEFKIRNTGFFQKLKLLSKPKIMVTGTHTSSFVVDQSSTATEIAGNGETSFFINFIPSSLGTKSVTLSITSNDTGKTIYTITLTGKSISGSIPVIDTGLEVTVVSPICAGASTSLTIADTESGINYRVFKGTVAVSSVVAGGGDLVIPIQDGSLSIGDNLLKVLCTKPGFGNDTLNSRPLIQVAAATRIETQPHGYTKLSGESVMLSVNASGADLSYQWRKGNTTLADDSRFSGTASSALTISNLVVADAGEYNCMVTGRCGNITSGNAILIVNKAIPVITFTSSRTEGLMGEELAITATSSSPAEITLAVTGGTGAGTFVSPSQLELETPGTIEVTASQIATPEYEVSIASQIITVHDPITAVEISNEQKASVYPNPTDGKITISSSQTKTVWLIDVFGTAIKTWEMQQGELVINLESISSGVYLIMGMCRNEIIFRTRILKR